jgi:hypothetical protein
MIMNDEISDAIHFYGFILPLCQKMSGEEFASRIEGFFSLENPRNRHYYNIIKDRLVYVIRYIDGYTWSTRKTN